MSSGPSTETPQPKSPACAGRQHNDCPGTVLGGNRGPTVPCTLPMPPHVRTRRR